jgi:hypothetical protein
MDKHDALTRMYYKPVQITINDARQEYQVNAWSGKHVKYFHNEPTVTSCDFYEPDFNNDFCFANMYQLVSNYAYRVAVDGGKTESLNCIEL